MIVPNLAKIASLFNFMRFIGIKLIEKVLLLEHCFMW